MKVACKVVGMKAGGREDVVADARCGDPVLLVPEPDNPYDPHAVAVYTAPSSRLRHRVVSSVVDPDRIGYIHAHDRRTLLMRQAGYLPRGIAERLDLPAEGIVGWVSACRHGPTEYNLFGEPEEPVVGLDVTAWLPTAVSA